MSLRALLMPVAFGAAFLLGAGTSPAAAETPVLVDRDAIHLVDGRHRGRGYGPPHRHWRGPPPRHYAPPPRHYRPPPVYYAPPPVYYAPPPRYYRPPPPPRYYSPPPGVGLYFRF